MSDGATTSSPRRADGVRRAIVSHVRRVAAKTSSSARRAAGAAVTPVVAFIALLAATIVPAYAQLTIEIIGGGAAQMPLVIAPFAGENDYSLGVSGVVGADLQRSGLFRLVEPGGARPSAPQEAPLADYRARGAEAVVIGAMTPAGGGNVNVRFYLLDAVKQSQITAFNYTVAPTQFRAVAHKIADVVYEALTGD
jgi:TolB protein